MNAQIERRPWRVGIAALVVLAAVAGVTLLGLPSAAQDQADTPQPITVTEITKRSSFTDHVTMQIRLKIKGRSRQFLRLPDPSAVAMAEIKVQPGAAFPWHTHPGPVIVTVKEGELTYVYADDCRDRTYPEGSAFVDPGYGNIHSAYNATDKVTVVMATFLDVPTEGPLTIPTGEVPGRCVPKGSVTSH